MEAFGAIQVFGAKPGRILFLGFLPKVDSGDLHFCHEAHR